jgi:lambda family phage portal protein
MEFSMDANAYKAQMYETAYRAASILSDQLKTWMPIAGSANRDFSKGEQNTITARSRDAFRNQPLARAAIERLEQAIVGRGITFQSRINYEYLGFSREDAMVLEQEIETYWEHWESHCDYEGCLHFRQLQALALSSWLQSGDVFINTPLAYEENTTFAGLRLQLIESDRVCNPNFTMDTDVLRNGVELDKGGRVLAYHVMRAHPYDNVITSQDFTWSRIKRQGKFAPRFLHLWKKERPGQVRGVPFLAPVLEPLKQLDRYIEAELQASVISALLTVFIKTEGGGGLQSMSEGQGKPDEVGLRPGAIVELLPGEDISSVNPSRPNRAFQDFVEAAYKQIGAALGVPMETLLLRYDSSYSAARAAKSDGWKKITQLRDIFVHLACEPIFACFMDELVAREGIKHKALKDYFANPLVRAAWRRGNWTGPARGSIDEEKEIRAAKDRVSLGVTSIAHECQEMGTGDWIDITDQRAEEHARRVAGGLEPSMLASSTAEGQLNQKGEPSSDKPE